MKVALLISASLNAIFLYYLIHDTIYYKKVIINLQEKYKKILAKK